MDVVHDGMRPGVDARSFEASGRLPTKQEAKAAVEQAYARFVAAHPNAREHWQKHCAELKARMERFQASRGSSWP